MVLNAAIKFPVKLVLAESDNVSSGPVKPVYVLASRQSYLPALADLAVGSFQHVLLRTPGQSSGHTPWFKLGGAPLNWTFPCGVLLDLIAPPPSGPSNASATHIARGLMTGPAPGPDQGPALGAAPPLALTVHYRDLPAALVPSWCNAGAVRAHYFNSLKEALYICRGPDGAGAVMRMGAAAQDELWQCVVAGRGAQAASCWPGLKAKPTERQGHAPLVPVRVFILEAGAEQQGNSWERAHGTSRPVEALQVDGSLTTVAHVLHRVAPALFPDPPPAPGPATAAAPAAAAAAGAAAESAAAAEAAAVAHAGEGPEGAAEARAPVADLGPPQAAGEGTGGTGEEAAGPGDGTCEVERSTAQQQQQQQPGTSGSAVPPAATAEADTGAGAGAGAAGGREPAGASSAGGAQPGTSSSNSGGGAGLGGAEGALIARTSSSGGGAGAAALVEAARRGPHPSRGGVKAWAERSAAMCRIVSSGASVPLHAPVAWLHARLHAADCFLYLVVHVTRVTR